MNIGKSFYSMLFLSLVLALTVGCANNPKGKGAHAFAQKGGGEDTIIQPPADPFESDRPIGEQTLAELIRQNPNSGMCERVHFDYDKASVRDEFKPCLDAIAAFFIANPGLSLVIEGHCDERGSNEYNMALGERRAVATAQYLIQRGLGESRISTRSMGEENPLESCSNESCWSKNRRADFYFTQQSR